MTDIPMTTPMLPSITRDTNFELSMPKVWPASLLTIRISAADGQDAKNNVEQTVVVHCL